MSSNNNTYFYSHLDPSVLAAQGAPLTWAFQTEIFGLIGIVIILIFVLLTRSYWILPGYTSVVFSLVAQVLLFMIYSVYVSEISWYLEGLDVYGPFYPLDRFTSSLLLAWIKVFLLFLTLACIFIFKSFFMAENDKWEYGLLLLIITLAMLILISTIDLFVGFIALEVQTITLYIMIGLKRYSNLSIEAAQKFFFFAAFSSCCFGLGLAIFYGLAGTTNIYHLSNYFKALEEPSLLAIFGGLLILTSLLFKLTLVPFHFWVGDVFQGSYGYFSSYLAIVSKLPVIALFVKFWYWVLILISPYFVILLKVISVLSIAVGTVYALTELNFKRFWALTAIGNLGYIVLAFSLGTAEGFTIGWFYLFLYLLNTLFVWIFVIHLAKKPSLDFSFNEFLSKLALWTSLSYNRLPLAMFFSFVLFSLAGLPPGSAFLPKAWLFLQFYLLNDFALLCVVFAFNVISMVYYIRLVRFILFPSQIIPIQESFVGFSSTHVYLLLFVFFVNLFCIMFFFDVALYFLNLAIEFISAL